jgi:hypothetical protein
MCTVRFFLLGHFRTSFHHHCTTFFLVAAKNLGSLGVVSASTSSGMLQDIMGHLKYKYITLINRGMTELFQILGICYRQTEIFTQTNMKNVSDDNVHSVVSYDTNCDAKECTF